MAGITTTAETATDPPPHAYPTNDRDAPGLPSHGPTRPCERAPRSCRSLRATAVCRGRGAWSAWPLPGDQCLGLGVEFGCVHPVQRAGPKPHTDPRREHGTVRRAGPSRRRGRVSAPTTIRAADPRRPAWLRSPQMARPFYTPLCRTDRSAGGPRCMGSGAPAMSRRGARRSMRADPGCSDTAGDEGEVPCRRSSRAC